MNSAVDHTSTALDVIRAVYLCGGSVRLEGDRLVMAADSPLPEEVRHAVRQRKSEIMIALGAPFDTAIAGVLADLRPHLTASLRKLSDQDLLLLVNWHIITSFQKAVRNGAIEDGVMLDGR